VPSLLPASVRCLGVDPFRLDARGPDPFHPLLPPFTQRTEGGEGVLHSGRNPAEDLPMHQAVDLHLPEVLHQHLLADARKASSKFAEAAGSVVEFPQ
jgi:hypothetical protein